MAVSQLEHPLGPETALVVGFQHRRLLRFQVGVAALDLAEIDVGRGDEVVEIELADFTLGAEAELVAGPRGPRRLEAGFGIDEGLGQVAVAGLADFGNLDPKAALDRQPRIRPPCRLTEQFAAQFLDPDRR